MVILLLSLLFKARHASSIIDDHHLLMHSQTWASFYSNKFTVRCLPFPNMNVISSTCIIFISSDAFKPLFLPLSVSTTWFLLLCHTQTLLSTSFQMRNTQSGVGHKGDKGSEIIHKLLTNSFSELDSSASEELKWGSIPILSRGKKTKAYKHREYRGNGWMKIGKMDRRGEE